MKLPQLNELSSSRTMIDVFRGYNHNLRISEGEFYDMTNLTSNDYPVLSPRPKRGVYKPPSGGAESTVLPQGLIFKDYLYYVDVVRNDHDIGARLYWDGAEVEGLLLSSRAWMCPKTLVSMGAYIIIMPDKKYYNTNDKTYGDIEAKFEASGMVRFTLCKSANGEEEDREPVESPTAPTNPNNLDLWIDTSGETHTLKQYSETNKQWVSIPTSYIKISNSGIDKDFNEGDGVTISNVYAEGLGDLNGTMVIQGKGDGWITVIGVANRIATQDDPLMPPLTIERKIPKMDFVIESNNRLWGCRYGVANNGQVVNEIYASKLGDFKNWSCFDGISTDSYVASVGTDGQFTGAISHLGYPIFFKENCMHKVYGNYPANFQIQTTACRGVQKGSEKSLAIVNEVLYYKSQSAICAYDGSLPQEVSSALGDVRYQDAVGGSLGNKYYVSMAETDYSDNVPVPPRPLFVYDTKKGLWHKEDYNQISMFCSSGKDLYFVEVNKIKSVLGLAEVSMEMEKTPRWSAETGIIGTDSPDKKYISKIDVRLSIKIGARVYFYIQYDSSGEWEHICTMTGRTLKSIAVPIRPQRCDHLRLRIDGDGETKIFSICKTIEQGSDM